MTALETMADRVVGAIGQLVARKLEPLVERLKAIEARQPEKGDKGEPGEDGKPGAKGADAVVDPEAIRAEVAKAVDAIPRPKDGEPGKPGQNGASVTVADVLPVIVAEVTKAVAAIPRPEDGEDGEPGRDALQIDILPTIDLQRSYPRRTYAQWKGGVIVSTRTTDAVKDGPIDRAGWAVVIEGIDDVAIVQGENLRSFAIGMRLTSGALKSAEFAMPVMIQRGIWKPGVYEHGDVTTRDGSQWHCEAERTEAEPGKSDDWRLIVKKGRDGRDADPGPKPHAPVRLQ